MTHFVPQNAEAKREMREMRDYLLALERGDEAADMRLVEIAALFDQGLTIAAAIEEHVEPDRHARRRSSFLLGLAWGVWLAAGILAVAWIIR